MEVREPLQQLRAEMKEQGGQQKKKKERDKNHLGHLKIRKRKGSKMLNV